MDKRIAKIESEAGDFGGRQWWIILKPGWKLRGEGTHAIVETRKRDALGQMSRVDACDCAECRQLLAVEKRNAKGIRGS